MSDRKNIKHNVERLLWAMSAGRCEKCGRLIYKHPATNTIGNFSQIAHNLPVSDFGPRSEFKAKYKIIDPKLDVDNVNNLLLLCYDCHKEIDEINPQDYTPDLLRQIKNDFEEFILKSTNIERIKQTIAVTYSPNLHGRQQTITGIQLALFPDKYIDKQIDLTLRNSAFQSADKEFFKTEEKNLVRIFNQKITPILEDNKNENLDLSVFAIGPIPLLVRLGTLLSNKTCIDVYQLKKSPASTWEWESSKDDFDYKIEVLQKVSNPKRIVVIFSISGSVNKALVQNDLSWEDATVIELKTTCSPNDDVLRTKAQLNKFVVSYRQLKEELLAMCEERSMVHVFAAVPVSVAVEIGRHWNSNVDLPMAIYNFTNGKYEKAIIIGEKDE